MAAEMARNKKRPKNGNFSHFGSGVAPANRTKEKVRKEKFMNFALFYEFGCFFDGKQA